MIPQFQAEFEQSGIHVVGKKTRSRNEIGKNEVGKIEPKLEDSRLLNT